MSQVPIWISRDDHQTKRELTKQKSVRIFAFKCKKQYISTARSTSKLPSVTVELNLAQIKCLVWFQELKLALFRVSDRNYAHLTDHICCKHKNIGLVMERLGRRQVTNPFKCKFRWRHHFNDVEGRPADIIAKHL